jgi:hypothetical protein
VLVEPYNKLLQTHFPLLKENYLINISNFWLMSAVLIEPHCQNDEQADTVIFNSSFLSFREEWRITETILRYLGQFEKHLLHSILLVGFTVQVDVNLHRHLPVLEYPSKGFKDQVEKPVGGLLLLQNLNNILPEEILNLRNAFKQPVLGQTSHQVIYLFKRRLIPIQQHPTKQRPHLLPQHTPKLLLRYHEQVRLLQ